MILKHKKLDSPLLKLIGQVADKMKLPCFVVGGWVRDIFLNRQSDDIDCLVVGSGIEVAQQLVTELGKNACLHVFKTYGTAQVKYKNYEIEFVGARRESYNRNSRNPIVEDGSFEDDIKRRDFTINAIAICLNQDKYGELNDIFDGVADIRDGIIQTPLDPDITFSDDPLRMMRAIRFATQLLGFTLAIPTFEAIQKNKNRIAIITKERIAEELNKIMLAPKPSVGWKLLDKTGLLPLILPELDKLKGIETKDGKKHKDVFLHTMQVVDNLAQAKKITSETTKEEIDNILWLRWAALLHDIAKPKCKVWNNNQGWTFHNHNYIGAKMVERIFKNLKLPQNEKMKYVAKLVDLHMRPINLVEDEVTDSAVRRLLFEAGQDIDDLLLLCHADITSRNEEKVQRYHKNFEKVQQKMIELEEKDRIRNFQPPVRGEEIMQLLNLSPCSLVGEIKNTIKDAILDGTIPNRYEEAKAYLFEIAKEKGLLKDKTN